MRGLADRELCGSNAGARRLHAFRSLADNKALMRALAAYALFVLAEYSVWIAMLVFAYSHGGAAIAGLVAVAQLVPAAVAAPMVAALTDRRSPVFMLAGGYLGRAVAVLAGGPLAGYAGAGVAAPAVAPTLPAQATLRPSLAVTTDQLTAANV